MINGGFADERLLTRCFGHPLLHSEWRRELPGLCARLAPRNRRRQRRSADWQSAVSPVGNRRACRLPVGETAGCQPALRSGYWAGMGRGGASRHRNPAIIARARRPTANSAVSKTRRPRPVAGTRIFRTRKPRPEAGTSQFKRRTPRPVVGTRAFRTRTSRPGSGTRDLKLGKPRPDTRTRPVKMWVGLPARRFEGHPSLVSQAA